MEFGNVCRKMRNVISSVRPFVTVMPQAARVSWGVTVLPFSTSCWAMLEKAGLTTVAMNSRNSASSCSARVFWVRAAPLTKRMRQLGSVIMVFSISLRCGYFVRGISKSSTLPGTAIGSAKDRGESFSSGLELRRTSSGGGGGADDAWVLAGLSVANVTERRFGRRMSFFERRLSGWKRSLMGRTSHPDRIGMERITTKLQTGGNRRIRSRCL